MNSLSIITDQAGRQTSRTSSPARPPISPIMPPLRASRFPGDDGVPRQTFTHSQQPDQATTGILHPAPIPIDFSSNPDAIALQSAISVLQVQRMRATAGIQALSRARDEAIQDPDAFVKDLIGGKVDSRNSTLRRNTRDEEDSGEEEGNEDEDSNNGKHDGKQREEEGAGEPRRNHAEVPREWTNLPKPQEIVRCPPINWSQYAVVGDSLDKLHKDQVTRPTQEAPGTLGPNGAYQFYAESTQEPYQGVAAPYAPGKDKIDRKTKARK